MQSDMLLGSLDTQQAKLQQMTIDFTQNSVRKQLIIISFFST